MRIPNMDLKRDVLSFFGAKNIAFHRLSGLWLFAPIPRGNLHPLLGIFLFSLGQVGALSGGSLQIIGQQFGCTKKYTHFTPVKWKLNDIETTSVFLAWVETTNQVQPGAGNSWKLLWMEEILHRLVDGFSHYNPSIYSVL